MVDQPRDRDVDRADEIPIRERPVRREEVDVVRERTPRVPYAEPSTATPANWTVDRIRWGPIFAGLVATVASLLLLNILGLAIGLSVLSPGGTDVTDLGTAAGLWGALAGLLSFFIGGWLAGRSSAPSAGTASGFSGWANGAMVWATTLVLLLLIGTIGAGGAFGFVGASFGNIVNALGLGNVSTDEALNAARNSAWGTLAGLALTLLAATLGGRLGQAAQPEDPETRR